MPISAAGGVIGVKTLPRTGGGLFGLCLQRMGGQHIMSITAFAVVLLFAVVLCIKEIPKMIKDRLFRELIFFSVLTALGLALTAMKYADVSIPNPSDLVTWIYSPLSDFMLSLIK